MARRNQRITKKQYLLIGAGALALALIAFSGICCWVAELPFLQDTSCATLSFWEFLAIASVVMGSFLVVRTLRHPRTNQTAEYSNVIATARPTKQTTSEGWQRLYNKLSDEERERVKTVIAKLWSSPSDKE